MATADLTVLALGRPEVSASEYIAEIQRRLRAQDRVRYRMPAMGTSLRSPSMRSIGGAPSRVDSGRASLVSPHPDIAPLESRTLSGPTLPR